MCLMFDPRFLNSLYKSWSSSLLSPSSLLLSFSLLSESLTRGLAEGPFSMVSMRLKWTQEEIYLKTGMDLAFCSSVRYCRSRSARRSRRGTSTRCRGGGGLGLSLGLGLDRSLGRGLGLGLENLRKSKGKCLATEKIWRRLRLRALGLEI